MKNNAVKTVKIILWVIFLLLFAGIFCFFRFRLPSPEFKVDNYQEFLEIVVKNDKIVSPDEDCLPAEPASLSVYVPNRFRFSSPEGYNIVIVMGNTSMSIRCRTLSSEINSGTEMPEFVPNQHIDSMPVNIASWEDAVSIDFLTEDCRYSIVMSGSGLALSQEQLLNSVLGVAQDLVEQCLNKE